MPSTQLVIGRYQGYLSPYRRLFISNYRLTFNKQGQITCHGDIWDVRDVLRLIPGVCMVQWFVGRAGAWGLSWISRKLQPHTGVLVGDAQQSEDFEALKVDGAFLTSAADSVA
ncbi:hypothetical protein BU15DRAFT_69490 [Melanogaster broomeanus]|nr:hypothetical protein BU15DRAFT_69490 [Melanogaster broomeanus]